LYEHAITDKNCFFDPSVRVPFMVSLPGRIKCAKYDHLIEAVDLLPTLLEFVGLPEPREVQGRSFAPLIADMGRSYEPHAEVFSENIIPEVITGGKTDMPFQKGQGVGGIRHPDAKMVRTEHWKYCYYPDGYAELYDLHADPLETKNLAGQSDKRDVEFDLRTRLLNWLINSQETDQIQNRWLLPEKK
jgi:arylsulfatase A-like enzyme